MQAHSEPPKAAEERHWIIGLSIAALVFFFFSIDAGIRDYKCFNKANSVATGNVVDNDEGASRLAHYQFNVNGIYYDGWVGNGNQSLAKGDPVQVRYNSSDPDFNHAEGDAPKNGFFNKFTFFGILCLIGIFMVIREKRKGSRVALV